MKCGEITVKELEDQEVAYVSFKGDYMGNPEVFAKLFEKLCGWAGPKGLINQDTKFRSAYYDDPQVTPPQDLRLDICMSINSEVQVDGEIIKALMPGGKHVVMNAELDGPQEYGPAWMKVVDYIKANNLEIDATRPSYELYLNCPDEHPEKHHILDVCMAVK
ncbi:MAG: GyrI-like domain-containing protein [Salinivirgaceae bacterium]|nr:GyrI-like domain-containing protein [Salinivirgaceae bacterium]